MVEAREEVQLEHISLDVSPHPITSAGRINRVAYEGQTLAEALRTDIPHGAPAIANVNGNIYHRSTWNTVTLKQGDTVVVKATIEGGGGRSNPLAIVLSIALFVAAPYLAGALGGALGGVFAPLTGSLAGIAPAGALFGLLKPAILLGGLLIINALFPPRIPKENPGEKQPERLFNITGGANRARAYEPVTLVFGTHRVFPDLLSADYTEYNDTGDQYLYQRFDFGIGNLEIDDLSIGSTPITSYSNVQLDYDLDSDLVAGNVDTIPGGEFTPTQDDPGNDVHSITRTTAGDTTAISFDLVSLHFTTTNKGKTEGRETRFRLRYRPSGSSQAWTEHLVSLMPHEGSEARNPVRRSFKYAVTKGAYDINVILRNAYADGLPDRVIYQPKFPQARAYQPDTADYTGRNPLSVRIRASGQLYGRIQQINGLVSHLIPDWNGANWVQNQVTSNPASAYLAFLRGFRIDGRLVAGLGLPDSRIDFDSIQSWHGFCETHELKFDFVGQDDRDDIEWLKLITQCGWASVDKQTGKYGVLYEDETTPMTAIITPASVVTNTLSMTYDNNNLADEVIGDFVDNMSDFKINQLRRSVPGTTNPETPVTIELEGITNGEHVAQEINRTVAAQFYHIRVIQWEMELDEGSLINRGDVVGMSHGILGSGTGSRLLQILSGRARVKPTVVPSSGGYAWIWDLNGNVLQRTYTVSDDTITLSSALPDPPENLMDDPLAYRIMTFPDEATRVRLRITGKEAAGARRLRFTARDEVRAYYDHRTSDLTWQPIPVGRLGGLSAQAVASLSVTENEVHVRVFAWPIPDPSFRYEIRYGAPGTAFGAMDRLHDGLLDSSPWEVADRPPGGTYRFGIVSVAPNGSLSEPTYTDATLEETPFAAGFNWRGDWDMDETYVVNDVVRHNNRIWVSLQLDNTGNEPEDGSAFWAEFLQDGAGYEYIYARTATATVTAAQEPDDAWGFDNPGTRGGLQWHDEFQPMTEAMPYIWRCERTIQGLPEVGAAIPSIWSEPKLVGRFGITGGDGIAGADGQDGDPGTDGEGVEYVFAATTASVSTIPANQRPANTWAYDRPAAVNGLTWHDDVPTISGNLSKIWRSQRGVPGSPTAGDPKQTTWSNWSNPKPLSELGTGKEYVFAVTNSSTLPTNQRPSNTWGYDDPGSVGSLTWHDGAPNVTATTPYLWRAERQLIGTPDDGDAVADNWSNFSIVGRWGADGSTGVAGDDGEDGEGIEFIFAVTASATLPTTQRPSNTWTFDNPGTIGGLQWSDGAPDTTATNQYLWMSQRDVPGGTSAGTAVSDSWSAPALISKFGVDGIIGSDGADGAAGTPGADGDDGQGIEYVFAVTDASITSIPSGLWPDDSWTFDNPGTRTLSG